MIKKKKVHILLIVIAATFLVYGVVNAVTPAPGSPEDPLIPKSYLDNQLLVLTQEINSLREEVAALKNSAGTGAAGDALFKVLTLSANQQLIAGEGTEIVLRGGAATAISGAKGDGLADVTAGLGTAHDLKTGDKIPVNHLLIVARDDGRGIKVENVENNTVYVLVKGPYRIE